MGVKILVAMTSIKTKYYWLWQLTRLNTIHYDNYTKYSYDYWLDKVLLWLLTRHNTTTMTTDYYNWWDEWLLTTKTVATHSQDAIRRVKQLKCGQLKCVRLKGWQECKEPKQPIKQWDRIE